MSHKRSPCHDYQLRHNGTFALSGDTAILDVFSDPAEEAEALEKKASLIDLCHYGVIAVTGKDRSDFFQRLSTVHVKALGSGRGARGAFLNANATVVSLFTLINRADSFLLVVQPDLIKPTLDFLEKFHFSEAVEFKDVSPQWGLLSLQGPQSRDFLIESLGSAPESELDVLELQEKILVRSIDYESDGYWILESRGKVAETYQKWSELGRPKGILPTGRLALEWTRLENGWPLFGADFDSQNIILEAGLTSYVHPNKGCYPGQEVVERIHTYGEVAKHLVLLEVHSERALKKGDPILNGEVEVGHVTTSARPPWRSQALALALVRKGFNKPGTQLRAQMDQAGPEGVLVTVSKLAGVES